VAVVVTAVVGGQVFAAHTLWPSVCEITS
jgi:preprotein translocase subunit Sec61beta